jgi:hypothetical protein
MSPSVMCDEFDGNGNVWRGDACIMTNVPYRVIVSQEIQDVPSAGTWPPRWTWLKRARPRTVSGRIFASVSPSYVGLPVELELEDGSRWPCTVQSADGQVVTTRGMIRSKA